MKLSRIIELALIHHYGYNKNTFMCHALDDMYGQDMLTKDQLMDSRNSIGELLDSIDKGSSALVSALAAMCYLEEDRINEKNIHYCTQLYVWWVFDLKNKGL